MSISRPVVTDESPIPAAMRAFLRNRFMEACGLALLAADVSLVVALATWSALDASLSEAYQGALANWMGRPGAAMADAFLQVVGLGVIAVVAAPTFWSLDLISHHGFRKPLRRLVGWGVSVLSLAGLLSTLPTLSGWPLLSGLGGRIGDFISSSLLWLLSFGLKGVFAAIVSAPLLALLTVWGFALAINRSELTGLLLSRVLGERGHDFVDALVGALAHWIFTLGAAFSRSRRVRLEAAPEAEDRASVNVRPGVLRRCLSATANSLQRSAAGDLDRVEPKLARRGSEPRSGPSAAARRASASDGRRRRGG